jgi:hypothetical protein
MVNRRQWSRIARLIIRYAVFASLLLTLAGSAFGQAGVIVPQNVAAGQQASGSIVANAKDWANVAGVRVIPFQLPSLQTGATPDLSKYVVEIGGHSVPANAPFNFNVTNPLVLRVRPAGDPNAVQANVTIPFTTSLPGNPRQPGYTTDSVGMPGLMQTVHGPFSGNTSQSSVNVNNSPAKIVAESQDSLSYLMPENTPAGPADVVVQDKDRKTRFRVVVLALQMSADKLQLRKGESTKFHVVVRGAEGIAPENWWGGEVQGADMKDINSLLPDFHPPTDTDRGTLVLIIENLSTNVVTMSGGNKIALTFTYKPNTTYTFNGSLGAIRDGGFQIDGTLIPFLKKQQGVGMPVDGPKVPSDGTTAGALREKAKEWRKKADDLLSQNGNKKDIHNQIVDCYKNAANLDELAYQLEHDSVQVANGQSSTDIDKVRKDANNQLTGNGPVLQADNQPPQVPGKNPGTTTEKTPKTPGTQTTQNPPTTPEPPNTPTTPPETPPKTPTTTPPGNPTPTQDRDKKKEDCPERGMGCVALIIDFSKDYSFEFDMSTIAKKFSSAGCDVDYVTPVFKEVPKPGFFSTPSEQEVKDAQDYNQKQWDAINDAIAKHREKVRAGKEIAIELTNGHGGEPVPGLPCGDVEPADWRGSYVRRDDFHLGNYKAANKAVCSWFTADLTCYGGLTPKVVDELENLTTATCNKASTIACGNHAGWEADGSMSSATSTETCSNGSVWWQSSYVKDALDHEIARRAKRKDADYEEFIKELHSKTVESTTARYTDRGYAKDHPPVHARGGYGEKSSDAK